MRHDGREGRINRPEERQPAKHPPSLLDEAWSHFAFHFDLTSLLDTTPSLSIQVEKMSSRAPNVRWTRSRRS
nr:hypothetical protein CFP56_21867 [Quercus suber]